MTWQQWTNKTIRIILNQSTFKDMCPPNHKHSAAWKESQPPRRCCMQHFWVSTAVPLNASTVSRNSSGVAQRAEVFRSDVILAENLQGAPSHLFFLSRSNKGRSNRIRERTGAPNTVARKKVLHFHLKFKWAKSSWLFHIKCSAFSILVDTNSKLSCQQGNDKIVLVFTTGNQENKTWSRKFTRGYKRCHGHYLHTLMHSNTFTHLCIKIHSGTHVTPVTAPIRNGYVWKHIPLALWKREEYGVQTLKKVKSAECPLSFFTLNPETSHWMLFMYVRGGQG